MNEHTKYNINLDVQFKHQELIDIPSIVNSVQEKWSNRTLTKINDSVVRLGIVEGEFHWHKHDEEDEFFYVVQGRFYIDLKDRSVELLPNQGFTVPKGTIHKTRAPERTVILMIEGAGVVPTGT